MNQFPPNTSDSGYFDSSHSLSGTQASSFHTDTPISKKRKASCIESFKQNVSECCYESPQFSSTLNESLMKNLENIHIESTDAKDSVVINKSLNKFQRCNDNRKFCSVPSTPEQQVKYHGGSFTKANTYSFKNFSQFGIKSQSPLHKEAYDILYPELPSLDYKKPSTSLKLGKTSFQAGKQIVYLPKKSPLKQVMSNHVIMEKVLSYLSNGDLHRLAQVSVGFQNAILIDIHASIRFLNYTEVFKHHKENYRITPPASPEKGSGSDSEIEASPGSKNFLNFYQIGKMLTKNQSLIKCPKCQKPSVVENDIAQCQNINLCGYIYCKRCDSFANNPKSFKDKCNNAQLVVNNRTRNQLGDLSNCTATSDYVTDISNSIFSPSFNLSMSGRQDSLGIFSECEVSTPKQKVRRNLSKSFKVGSELKIFSSSNVRVPRAHPKKELLRRTSVVPVVPLEPTKMSSNVEPSSPSNNQQQYSVCSKRSKRNLTRLTW